MATAGVVFLAKVVDYYFDGRNEDCNNIVDAIVVADYRALVAGFGQAVVPPSFYAA